MSVVKRLSLFSVVCCGLVVATFSGCGGSSAGRPTLVPVSGTVMYNGSAIAGATVSFWAEKAPRPATGVTDANGYFKLSMFGPNDGAMPGENVITVTKNSAPAAPSSQDTTAMLNDPSKMTSMMQAAANDKTKAEKPEVAAKYGERGTTPLKETVAESGTNEFLLQLTGD